MKDIVIVGAGKIGTTIAAFLAHSRDYRVTVVDRAPAALAALARTADVSTKRVDLETAGELRAAMGGCFAVVNAAPYYLTEQIAEAAKAVHAHYLDLTEDVTSTRRVLELAQGSDVAFVPQCGLAPGFVSIVASDLVSRFESVDTVQLRVGALPQFPTNALNYNLTWSTDGVINEYCEPCEAIVEGVPREVQPLEGYEQFSLDGIVYEAFNTAGGLGSMSKTLRGKARNVNYKTIRYPGHAAIMKILLQDLRLRERRNDLRSILEFALPSTNQDVVIIVVSVNGIQNGRLIQETYSRKIYSQTIHDTAYTAIQVTTAAGVCAVLDLVAAGQIAARGIVKQEDIPLELFLANRFGRIFSTDGQKPAVQTAVAETSRKPSNSIWQSNTTPNTLIAL